MRYLDRYLRVKIKNLAQGNYSTFDESWKITFRVRKCASASIFSYNTMELSIYNLNDETRRNLSEEQLPIIVDAGYKDLKATIFDGIVNNITTSKIGTDIITTFYCSSNIQRYNGATNITFRNIKVVDAIKELCKMHGIEPIIPSDLDKGIISSYACTEPLQKELEKICYRYGISIGLDNGEIVFADKEKKEKGVINADVKVFTPSNGLLGNPTVLHTGIKVNSLMQPQIRVNDYFRLFAPYADYNLSDLTSAPNLVTNDELKAFAHIKTKDYNGLYRALAIIHSGDTRGNEWKTEFDGVRL